MFRELSLAAGVAALSCPASALADLILVQDLREITAFASVAHGGTFTDGPHVQSPSSPGALFEGSIMAAATADQNNNATALAEQTSSISPLEISVSNHLHVHTQGATVHAYAISTADITFLVEAGTEIRIIGGAIGAGVVEVTDSGGATLYDGDGVFRRLFTTTEELRLTSFSIVEHVRPDGTNRVGIAGATITVVPAPASAAIFAALALGGRNLRRRPH